MDSKLFIGSRTNIINYKLLILTPEPQMHEAVHAGKDNLVLATSAILIAVLSLSFGDAVIKLLSSDLILWQIYVMRSLLALPLILVIIRLRHPGISLVPTRFAWTLIRSLLLGAMWVAYYAALPEIKLSVAAAIYYTIPLFITLFSALFTGDRVSRSSWAAIAIGFAGVLVIVRPANDSFSVYVLLPLLAAILYALAMILTRTKCRQENPGVLSLALNLTFIAMGLVASLLLAGLSPETHQVALNPFLLGDWRLPGVSDWLAMAVLAIVVVAGSILAALAYQRGPSPIIATFDYSYLAFSAFWGFVLFLEVPDTLTLLGMALIVVAGITAIRN